MTLLALKTIFSSVLLIFASLAYAMDAHLTTITGPNVPDLSPSSSQIIAWLQKQGISVHTAGELKIIIPIDNFFMFPSHTRLYTGNNEILRQIAILVSNYGSRPVQIDGYTDNVGSDLEKLKRTQDQANAVASYLWAYGGIALNHMHIQGRGDTHPVADNDTFEGSAANRRIEITVRS